MALTARCSVRRLIEWATSLALAWVLVAPSGVHAGVLDKAALEEVFGPALVVGEKNSGLPVWPLFAREENRLELRGYAFESLDFEPVRGYSGKPINLLVAIDPAGIFLDVRLLGHDEPFFTSAAGTAVLNTFAAQYKGLSIHHRIEIFGHKARASRDAASAKLHGVAAGTVTVKAMDVSILESATSVARAHIAALESGSRGALNAAPVSGARSTRLSERHTPLSWQELVEQGAVQSLSLTRGQIENAFVGTRAAGADKRVATAPDETALSFHIAFVSIPKIGRNLLDDTGWRQLNANLRRASHALLVTESGPLARMAYESQRVQQAVPFVLKQGGKELRLRAMAYDTALAVPGYPQDQRAHLLLVDAATPLDPAQPFDLSFRLQRRWGSFPDQLAQADFALGYQLPDAAAWVAASYEPAWFPVWRQRALEIAILIAALGVLVVALARQQWLSTSQRRLKRFRISYLLFTLFFIGWYAQGQLTVVNLSASVEALAAGGDLTFLLTDPITVLLWFFVGVTLLIWGRGTFCGWLCPFGALQELISVVTRRLGLQPRRVRAAMDTRLKRVKYGVLAVVLGSVFLTPAFAPGAAEVEPFKTAISAYFVRDWPYLLWAVMCLGLSVFVYRGYCRYICPLGAALAATDLLRRWAWIPRRSECGTPCQSCRHRCDYQAIEPIGKVTYAECFQCLDCVAIHQDDARCLPLIQSLKPRARVFPIRPVASS